MKERSFLLALLLLMFLCLRPLAAAFLSNLGFLQLRGDSAASIWQNSAMGGGAHTFRQALDIDPRTEAAWRGLGFAYAAAGETAAAVEAWAHVPALASEMAAWARQANQAGATADAVERFQLAALVDPTWGDPWYRRGQLLLQSREPDAAAESFLRALQAPRLTAFGRSDVHFALGRAYVSLAEPRWAAGAEAYDTALKVDQFSDEALRVEALYGRGEALRRLGEVQQAKSDLQAVLAAKPSHYWAYVQLGTLLWESEQDVLGAEAAWQSAIRLQNDWIFPYRNLGLMYEALDRPDEAVAVYQTARIHLPDDAWLADRLVKLNPNAASDRFYETGREAMTGTPPDWDAALAQFNLAIARNDFSGPGIRVNAYYNRGEVQRNLEAWSAAREDYETVVRLNPDHYWAHMHLATLEYEREGNGERAEALWLRAATIRPDLKWAFRRLGEYYEHQERGADAIAAYEEVLARDPGDSEVQRRLEALEANSDP